MNRLRVAGAARVVLVTAPPGYGKTTLVADWARREDRPVIWYAAAGNTDGSGLAAHLLSALDGLSSRARPVAAAAQAASGSLDEDAARIGRAVAATDGCLIVIDNAHHLRDPDSAQLLARLTDELPSRTQLVLVGRSLPAVAIARLRAAGQLIELGLEELTFNDREAAALLRHAGVRCRSTDAQALNAVLEGWPAGLYLATLAMRGNDPGSGAAAAGPLILDYLRSELVSHLSEDDLRFLTRSSVLERLSGSLCDAVTEMEGSTDRLERIEAANLFIIPLDRERQWYRMQAVVRNVLAAELERLEPGIARGLQSRAASWSARHGDLSGALEYARAARDMPQLIELIESSVLPFAATAQPASVERLLILLDDPEILRQHPALAAIGALAWGMTGRPDLAERWASASGRSSSTRSAWRSLLHAVMQPAGPDDMAAAAGDALARMPFESMWRAPALLTVGIASILGGAEREAMLMLRQAGDVAAAANAPAVEAAALGCESLAAAALGQWAVADSLAHAGRRLVDERKVQHEVIILFALAASARTALRSGNWAGARSELELANTLLPRLTHAVAAFAVPLRITFARIYHALGELADAHRLLDEIDEIFRRQPQLDLCRYDAEELRSELIAEEHGHTGHTSPLTAAELRLLPLLVTHRSFREIAEQLYVSRNTVKTQAISVYRKLGVSSRADAIGRASTLGLVASDEKVR